MRKVTKTTVFGPEVAPTTAYDALRIGPPGPRGLQGDPGPKGDKGDDGDAGSAGVVISIPITCHNDLTAHEVSVVLDGGVYTTAVSQTAAPNAGDPETRPLACITDGTVHDLKVTLEGGVYTLEPAQAVSTTPSHEAAIPIICATDGTIHYLSLVLDGQYTVAVSQASGGGGGVTSVFGETGGITSVDYITIRCVADNTFHRYTVVVSPEGQHVLERNDA